MCDAVIDVVLICSLALAVRCIAVMLPAIPPITLKCVLKFLLFAAIVVFIALGVKTKAIEFHFDRF